MPRGRAWKLSPSCRGGGTRGRFAGWTPAVHAPGLPSTATFSCSVSFRLPAGSSQSPTDGRREKLRRLLPWLPAAPRGYFRLQDPSCGPSSYSSPSGSQDLPCPCTLPLQALGVPEKAAISLRALHSGPRSWEMLPVLNSAEPPTCAIGFLLGSLRYGKREARLELETFSDCDP